MKLSDIYGIDETSTASEVASKALSAPKLVDPLAHANPSKGGGGDATVSNSTAVTKDGLSGALKTSKGN